MIEMRRVAHADLRSDDVEKDESTHVPMRRHLHTVPAYIEDLVCIVIHLDKHAGSLLVETGHRRIKKLAPGWVHEIETGKLRWVDRSEAAIP